MRRLVSHLPIMRRRCKALLIAAVLCTPSTDSLAQDTTVSQQAPMPPQLQSDQTTTTAVNHVPPPPTAIGRKKIGLVLEGGGALGLAHIGVIRWMEQHRIPVDYVAGTSMGGLVGGLYAAGYSPDEIDQLVSGIDWSHVLSGQLQFEALNYRRKEDKVAYPNRMEFGLKHGISLPGGLNSGASVNLLFDTWLLPYWDLHNFDDLPIPFRCVATELNTGQAHVFEDGPLSRALRSTMSIPGVFAPVRIGNDLFADGAAVDNLPVDVARSMGAQVIISSYLNTGPPNPDTLNSIVGVAGRNVSIMVAANEVNSLKNSDVVVSSDVSKYGALEFSKAGEIIPVGEQAAQLEAADLEKYALSEHDWQVYLEQRQARRQTKIPVPQFVEISNVQGAQRASVQNAFGKYAGQPIDTAKLQRSIADMQGSWLYSGINYSIVDREGIPGLLVRPVTKDYGPPFMNFGPSILTNDSNDIQLGVGFRATFFNVVGPGSEVRIDAAVGQPAGLRGELFKPIRPGWKLFAAPHIYLAHQNMPYYQGSTQLEQYKERRNGVGIDLGYLFNSRTELRLGEDVQWYQDKQQIGSSDQRAFSIVPYVSRARFQYLGQNDMMVPTQGTIALATYNYYTARPFNAPGGYSQLNGKLQHFIPTSEKTSLFGIAQGGTSFGASNLGLTGLSTGGPFQLSAYARNELLGTDYFVGSVGVMHKMVQLNPVIADGVYLGGMYEIGKMYGGNSSTPSLPNSVTGFAIIKTLIGPIFGGISIGDSDHRKWFFGLGRVF